MTFEEGGEFVSKSGVVKSSEDKTLEGVRERLRVKWVGGDQGGLNRVEA